MVTDSQVRLLMKLIQKEPSLKVAAAKAGMDAMILASGSNVDGKAATFDFNVSTDAGRTLTAIVLQPAHKKMASDQTCFNLLAVTGVRETEASKP